MLFLSLKVDIFCLRGFAMLSSKIDQQIVQLIKIIFWHCSFFFAPLISNKLRVRGYYNYLRGSIFNRDIQEYSPLLIVKFAYKQKTTYKLLWKLQNSFWKAISAGFVYIIVCIHYHIVLNDSITSFDLKAMLSDRSLYQQTSLCRIFRRKTKEGTHTGE